MPCSPPIPRSTGSSDLPMVSLDQVRSTVIVTADHGGHGTNHGSDDPLDVTISWMAWGQGVRPGTLASSVSQMDTASTVLWLLGVSKPADWAGVALEQAFGPSPPGPSGRLAPISTP